MRKILLLISFFVLTPSVVFLSIILFLFLSFHQSRTTFANMQAKEIRYAALPTAENIFQDSITETNAQAEILRQFFHKYGSPLEPLSQLIVDTSEKYGLDPRLLPSIAMTESGGCEKIPAGSHNCWGFGIYGGKILHFNSYEEGIETVAKTLSTKYKARGLETPEEIEKQYTPNSNGHWQSSVYQFMNELQ